MTFGRLLSYEVKENLVLLHYEKRDARLEIITPSIINVFAGFMNEKHRSKAIEGEKKVPTEFTAVKKEDHLEVATACLTVKVRDEFKVDFYQADGVLLCRDYSGKRTKKDSLREDLKKLAEAEGHKINEEDTVSIQVIKQLEGDESFYGLGDKTGFLNKRGYEYEMWNSDLPQPQVDSFKSLYKSIPFTIVLREKAVFGLFFDNPYHSYFDMGKESENYYFYGVQDGNLNYYMIAGQTMAEVVSGYTYLTGTTPAPQRFTLGHQQSRWGYVTQDDVYDVAGKMRENDIPCDVIHLDIDYMDAYKVFTWNEKRYADPAAFINKLSEQGFKIVTIIDPGVKKEEGYEIYETGVKNDYFVKTPEGEIYENVVWPGVSVFPDFGAEKVRDWWADNTDLLLKKGVAGIWNDMNEPASFRGPLPEDVVFTDEDEVTNHARMHNLYGHNMAKATYEGIKKHTGKRPFVITRACYAGTQKYATAWTGDNHSIWAHLQMMIPQLCNLGLSGMSFVGTDIGGFGSDCTKELLCRWVEAGCFSPLFRNHSALDTRNQEAWQFDQETLDIYRKYVDLRYKLIPYYYDLFFQGEKDGQPIMRPLIYHYEKDEQAKNCNDEFLIGESILVSPVVTQGSVKKMVYLPEGSWYDYWTGEKIEGNTYFIADAPLDMCPVYVKAGSILPVYPRQSYVGEKDVDKILMLEIFPGEGSICHFQDNGEDFAYREGAYNEYQMEQKDGKLKIALTHRGYEKVYEKVQITCMSRTYEIPFEAVCSLTLE